MSQISDYSAPDLSPTIKDDQKCATENDKVCILKMRRRIQIACLVKLGMDDYISKILLKGFMQEQVASAARDFGTSRGDWRRGHQGALETQWGKKEL